MQVNVHTARSILLDLILRAEAGEEVVIASGGKPAVLFVPIVDRRERSFRRFRNLNITGDAVGPLKVDELRHWEDA